LIVTTCAASYGSSASDEQGALPLADRFTSERVHPALDQLGTIDNIVN
jgi:hypothetical protein